MDENPLPIRAHHLLCMLGFRGLGYSKEFVRNMTRIVRCIRDIPEAAIKLIETCDVICRACPHREDGVCGKSPVQDERPGDLDRAVLAVLGYEVNARTTSGEAYRRIASRIDPADIGRLFCTRCEWRERGYCVSGLAELKQKASAGGL